MKESTSVRMKSAAIASLLTRSKFFISSIIQMAIMMPITPHQRVFSVPYIGLRMMPSEIAPPAIITAVQPTSCSTLSAAKNFAPCSPKESLTLSIAPCPDRPPIKAARYMRKPPIRCPATTAPMPRAIPSGAISVPVYISAMETAAPNQISALAVVVLFSSFTENTP